MITDKNGEDNDLSAVCPTIHHLQASRGPNQTLYLRGTWFKVTFERQNSVDKSAISFTGGLDSRTVIIGRLRDIKRSE